MRHASSSTVGTLMQTVPRAAFACACRTSMSRTIIGPLVMMPIGLRPRAGDVAGGRLRGAEIEEKWRNAQDIRLCFATSWSGGKGDVKSGDWLLVASGWRKTARNQRPVTSYRGFVLGLRFAAGFLAPVF